MYLCQWVYLYIIEWQFWRVRFVCAHTVYFAPSQTKVLKHTFSFLSACHHTNSKLHDWVIEMDMDDRLYDMLHFTVENKEHYLVKNSNWHYQCFIQHTEMINELINQKKNKVLLSFFKQICLFLFWLPKHVQLFLFCLWVFECCMNKSRQLMPLHCIRKAKGHFHNIHTFWGWTINCLMYKIVVKLIDNENNC